MQSRLRKRAGVQFSPFFERPMAYRRVPPAAGANFLRALAEGMSVTAAARAANVSRRTVYLWRRDPGFAESWADALEAATDLLEDAARTRATDGMSDRLLMALLAARRPERFGQKAAEPGLTDDALEGARAKLERKLLGLARRAAARRSEPSR
jgi:hypothetical protein